MYAEIFVCLLFTIGSFPIPLPNSFKQCDRKSADFSVCLTTAVTDALSQFTSPIKPLGLPTLDPLEIPSLEIEAGTGAVRFQQNYKNMKVTGLSQVKCASVNMDFAKKTMVLDCTSPVVRMDFDYDINGRILLLPIYGHGPGEITLNKLKIEMSMQFEEVSKHFKIVDKKLTFTPASMHYRLDNLFNGDKALGDNINDVLNDNWKDVFEDVKPSYEEAFAQIFGAIVEKILGKVSVTELFGNE